MKHTSKLFFIAVCLFFASAKSAEGAIRAQAVVNNALLEAAKLGNVTQVQNLLKRRENPNTSNMHANTPLHFAAHRGHQAIAQVLVAAQANINARNSSCAEFSFGHISNTHGGVTPLMLACSQGNLGVVTYLLTQGAEVNAQDHIGQTALTYALLTNKEWPNCALTIAQKAIIYALISHGANPYLEDDYGLTPLYYYERMAELFFNGNEWTVDTSRLQNDKLYNALLHSKVY